jgi:hypothetical protein
VRIPHNRSSIEEDNVPYAGLAIDDVRIEVGVAICDGLVRRSCAEVAYSKGGGLLQIPKNLADGGVVRSFWGLCKPVFFL